MLDSVRQAMGVIGNTQKFYVSTILGKRLPTILPVGGPMLLTMLNYPGRSKHRHSKREAL
jgi:hypothetical protein